MKNFSFTAAAFFMHICPVLNKYAKMFRYPPQQWKLVKQTYSAWYIFAFIPVNELFFFFLTVPLWIFNWLESRSHSSALQSQYKTLVAHKTGTFAFLQPWIPQPTQICKDQRVIWRFCFTSGSENSSTFKTFAEDLESQMSGLMTRA